MSIDVSPTKEIKGITIRSVVQFVIIVSTVIITYMSIKNGLTNISKTQEEMQRTAEKNQNYNELTLRAMDVRLRDLEIRIKILEVQQKIR